MYVHVCSSIKLCTYRYDLNQTVIFSATVAIETPLPEIDPTIALKSVFTTKVAMCSGVPSRFWTPVRWIVLTSFW